MSLLGKVEEFAEVLAAERERYGFVWIGTCPIAPEHGHDGPHLAYAFRPDGQLLIATSDEDWTPTTDAEARERFPGANLPTWSPSWVS